MSNWDIPPFAELEHERVEIRCERLAGLVCVVAIHSTVLGPAMGGVRRTAYGTLEDAIGDALRLSRAMTIKNSLAGLPLGGGKCVIADPSPTASDQLLDAFADFLEGLGGRYVAAEDIGTTPADMDRLALQTRYVAGRPPESGGTGDPSPATARTVLGAIGHALRVLDGPRGLEGRRVGIIGVGMVGSRLAEMLAEAGAEVLIADSDESRASAVAARTGGDVCSVEDVAGAELDVLAPCARGGFVTRDLLRRLKARVLCGAANNILQDERLATDLARAGVLYVPEFAANSGGIIQVGGEFLEWDSEQIEAATLASIERTGAILDAAAASGRLPVDVAMDHALERLGSPVSAGKGTETAGRA